MKKILFDCKITTRNPLICFDHFPVFFLFIIYVYLYKCVMFNIMYINVYLGEDDTKL